VFSKYIIYIVLCHVNLAETHLLYVHNSDFGEQIKLNLKVFITSINYKQFWSILQSNLLTLTKLLLSLVLTSAH